MPLTHASRLSNKAPGKIQISESAFTHVSAGDWSQGFFRGGGHFAPFYGRLLEHGVSKVYEHDLGSAHSLGPGRAARVVLLQDGLELVALPSALLPGRKRRQQQGLLRRLTQRWFGPRRVSYGKARRNTVVPVELMPSTGSELGGWLQGEVDRIVGSQPGEYNGKLERWVWRGGMRLMGDNSDSAGSLVADVVAEADGRLVTMHAISSAAPQQLLGTVVNALGHLAVLRSRNHCRHLSSDQRAMMLQRELDGLQHLLPQLAVATRQDPRLVSHVPGLYDLALKIDRLSRREPASPDLATSVANSRARARAVRAAIAKYFRDPTHRDYWLSQSEPGSPLLSWIEAMRQQLASDTLFERVTKLP